MLNDWSKLVGGLRAASGPFGEAHPQMLAAYRGLGAAQPGPGTLDAKTRELIALAVAVTDRKSVV